MQRRALGLLVGLAGCTNAITGGGGGDSDAGVDPVACGPSAGGPLWLEEGESVAATVACSTGAEPGAGFAVTGLPVGASFDAATGAIAFTPGLDQAAVYRIALSAIDEGEIGELVIGVADRFDDPANTPVVDPAAYSAEYGLPVFFVSTMPTDSELYQPVTVTYGGRSYAIQGKLRGASSLSYPKKSLTLDFSGDHLTDTDRGMIDEKKIVLTTTFDDNSLLRARLTWDLWNALDPTIKVAAYSAVVFVDGAYAGVYTVSDHIDDELMAQAGLPEAGNLYKAINHDANFQTTLHAGGAKATLHDGYEKKHGLPDPGVTGAFDDLDALVSFVAGADDATFGAGLEDRIALDDFEAWYLLATFLKLNDSAGKNSYLHKSPTTPWHVVPWDFNDSLGQSWETQRQGPTPVATYDNLNRLFARIRTHADFAGELAGRYAAELQPGGAFAKLDVLAALDAMAAELAPASARDERRWRAEYLSFPRWAGRTDFTTATAEVAYVRAWLDQRWAALAALYP